MFVVDAHSLVQHFSIISKFSISFLLIYTSRYGATKNYFMSAHFLIYSVGFPEIWHFVPKFVECKFSEFLHYLSWIVFCVKQAHPTLSLQCFILIEFLLLIYIGTTAISCEYMKHWHTVLEVLIDIRENTNVILAEESMKVLHPPLMFLLPLFFRFVFDYLASPIRSVASVVMWREPVTILWDRVLWRFLTDAAYIVIFRSFTTSIVTAAARREDVWFIFANIHYIWFRWCQVCSITMCWSRTIDVLQIKRWFGFAESRQWPWRILLIFWGSNIILLWVFQGSVDVILPPKCWQFSGFSLSAL